MEPGPGSRPNARAIVGMSVRRGDCRLARRTHLASLPRGGPMSRFLRFADPETERAYLRAERAARGQPIRALIVIAVVTLVSYIVINPMHFPPEGVRDYTLAAGFLGAVLGGFFALTRTQFYLDHP